VRGVLRSDWIAFVAVGEAEQELRDLRPGGPTVSMSRNQ